VFGFFVIAFIVCGWGSTYS